MSPAKAKNIVELRQLLAEKFPGVRMAAGRPESAGERWPTGIAAIDLALEGGLRKSAVTELVSPGTGNGSALLLAALVRQASRNGQWAALIDGADSFDPGGLENGDLARLLWVRCSAVREAIQAADLLLHDGTAALLALDLIYCPRTQLRRVPLSTWHRFARTAGQTGSAFVIFTPEHLVTPAADALELRTRFTLEALEESRETLLDRLIAEPVSAGAAPARKESASAG